MKEWLSSAWEANWKSFQYFNFYRLIMAVVLMAMGLLSHAWLMPFRFAYPAILKWLGLPYILMVGIGTLASLYWRRRFNMQLSIQILIDALAGALLMHAAGGVASGFGLLLLISLAAASLVGRGRLVLFYAALATLAVLVMQANAVLAGSADTSTIIQAGLLSMGFFATAILARLLGQRVMANEELARRRGIALENQTRINQRVLERMQDGILIVGRDGRICRRNPVAEAMLGAAEIDRALWDYSAGLGQGFAAWLAGQGADSVDFPGARGRGLRARFEPTDSTDGEILVFLEDVERIQERAQQLKLASLGRLTASIAHEIRNPLSAISHAGDLLREERRVEMQDRLLRILNDNVGRLDRIVKDILELGRSDRVYQEHLRLDEFVTDFVAEFTASGLADEGVVLVEAAASVELCFDRNHLRQILWNLASNGVRHSKGSPGSVRLRVSAPVDRGRVELHVIDDGPGVPAEIREQVFEPFFTTHHKGTGLGLFVARELCEANGASLSLAPRADCGHFILSGRNDRCQTQGQSAALAAS